MNKSTIPMVCPSCGEKSGRGKKSAYKFVNTGIIKCSACGYDTTAEYKEKMRQQRDNANQAETTLELVEEYRHNTGKTHRFSDKVLSFFKINATTHVLKNGKHRRSLILSNHNGQGIKFLSRSSKVKPIWMALQNQSWWFTPERVKDIKGILYIAEGPWDVFALYDALDIVAISPINGAGSIVADAVAELRDEFDGHEIVIVFDNDKAARAGVEKAARNILELSRPKSVSIVDLSKLTKVGGDIDDLVAEGKIEELKSALSERHFIATTQIAARWPLPPIPVSFYDSITVQKIWNVFSLAGIDREMAMAEISFSISSDPTLAKTELYKIRTVYSEMVSYALQISLKEIIAKYRIVKNSKDLMFQPDQFEPWQPVDGSELYRLTCEIYGNALGVNVETQRKKAEVEHIYHSLLNYTEMVEFNLPNRIFFRTKIFDSKTKQFRSYERDDYYSAKLDYDPDFENSSTVLNDVLKSWFNDSQTIFEFKKLMWFVMSRRRDDAKFFLFVGQGGDGKGEAAKMFESLVPQTSYVPIEKLLGEKNDTYLVAIAGCDLNVSDELPVNGRVTEETLKRLTGGAKITTDRKFKVAITTYLRAAYIILSNTIPAVSDLTASFYQRLKIFEFKNTFRNTDKEKRNFFKEIIEPAMPSIAYQLCAMSSELDERFSHDAKIEERVRLSSPIYAYWEEQFDSDLLLPPFEKFEHEGRGIIAFNITEHYKKFKDYSKENRSGDNTSSERFSRGSADILFSFLQGKKITADKEAHRMRKAKSRYIYYIDLSPNNNRIESADMVDF